MSTPTLLTEAEASAFLTAAAGIAVEAHARQARRYTDEPYAAHPIAVAMRVARLLPEETEAQAAALLHDVLEDDPNTPDALTLRTRLRERLDLVATRKDLNGYMAPAVVKTVDLVEELTDHCRPEDGNRKTRKAMERARLGNVSQLAKVIKLADLEHNSRSIFAHDSGFAPVYLREGLALLDALAPPPKDGRPIGAFMTPTRLTRAHTVLHFSVSKQLAREKSRREQKDTARTRGHFSR